MKWGKLKPDQTRKEPEEKLTPEKFEANKERNWICSICLTQNEAENTYCKKCLPKGKKWIGD